jgi:amino acid transporter
MDYFSALNGHNEAVRLVQGGKIFSQLEMNLQDAFLAWNAAPKLGGFHFVADIPALGIIVFITWLVYRGMKESKNASNFMVIVKLAIILLVIAVGIFYVDTDNWNPFAPNGISGVLKGVSAVFFAYIGFDAISTTAEECKDPQRDLPRGMMWAIIICTILYIVIALILTGMVNYTELNVGDPLAYVFQKLNIKWLSGIIAFSAVIAMASVLLVFQMGQPRIWMSMSRDGLLPKRFSKIHPKFKTPSFSTIVVGFVVAVPALFLNLTTVTDLCSIGTLFAFVVVCGGVLYLQNKPNIPRGKFKTPYINGKYVMPILLLIGIIVALTNYKKETVSFLTNERKMSTVESVISSMNMNEINTVKQQCAAYSPQKFKANNDVESFLSNLKPTEVVQILKASNIKEENYYEAGFDLFQHKIPTYIFLIITLLLTFLSVTHNLSLIPMLGLISCLYMMSELNVSNWIGFGVWLIVGLLVYFGYSRKHSKLNASAVE